MRQHHHYLLSALAGVMGFAALFTLYIGIVSLVSGSLSHALSLLAADQWLVATIATGFGIQMGLFAFLRLGIRVATHSAGLVAGAGTGASTISMIACCVHHVSDVAPVLGLVGLSSTASFLAENKVPFVLLGLAMNTAGIILIVRSIQKSRAQLDAMSVPAETENVCYQKG